MSDFLDRLHSANELISIYEMIEHVPDHSRPRKIHCPVHNDRTKSAQVYPESNSVYCFTEGVTYDPVGLVAEEQGLSTIAAIDYIEKNAGVRWERQERDEDVFWEYVRKDQASVDDPQHWTRQEMILWRWEVHRTVAELGTEVEWDEFDNLHLDVEGLRSWRQSQLDKRQAAIKVTVND